MPRSSPSFTGTTSRRDFLKTASMAAGAGVLGGLSIARSAHGAGASEVLRVGLIGCGGRGTGAARDAMAADKQVKVVALADAFEDRVQNCRKALQTQNPQQTDIPDDHLFVGFDAYKQLLACGVDVVLLCEPPHFRPLHLRAAVEAGKHIFCEKPVAVDAPGYRSVVESCNLAEQKGLSIVSGLCWRYHPAVIETMKRVQDGAIGQIVAIQETYLTALPWARKREPGQTEMVFQMRNWYNFHWLSGDHNVEQHVHSLDKGSWAMGDKPPVRAWGTGGRQSRGREPEFGNIYDHHAVVYEYENGARMYSYCRQQRGAWGDVSDHFLGTKGTCVVLPQYKITDRNGQVVWKYEGPGGNMYELEHEALFKSIRSGKPINNGHYMALSTMLAILGRMVTYTGKVITWEEAINSQEDLSPKAYRFDADPPVMPGPDGLYPLAIPGVTTFK